MNLILDGDNLLYRTYWIAKSKVHLTADKSNDPTIEDNNETGCIFIFLNSLKSYVEKFKADNVYVAWDKKLLWPSTNFRKQLMEGTYKATRDKSSSVNIHSYEEMIIPILESLGVKNIFPRVLEGDDVIAWLCSNLLGPKVIVSLDHDFLQLISDQVKFYNPNKKVLITLDNFEQEVNVKLQSFLYYKVILGDPADNIIGFPGHGKVRARKLADKLVENFDLKNLSPEYTQIFNRNYKIICLKDSWKQEIGEEESYYEQFVKLETITTDVEKFKKYSEHYNFETILNKFDDWKRIFRLEASRLIQVLGGDFAANL